MTSKDVILRIFWWCLSTCVQGFHSGARAPMPSRERREQGRVNRLELNRFFSPLRKMRICCEHRASSISIGCHGDFHFDSRPATFFFLNCSK